MYRIKECVDEFEYKFKDSETGKIKKFKITEKRIVTFNPRLARSRYMRLTSLFLFVKIPQSIFLFLISINEQVRDFAEKKDTSIPDVILKATKNSTMASRALP